MTPCTHPGIERLFYITAKNDLGRLALSALPQYGWHYSPFPSTLRVFILTVRVVQHFLHAFTRVKLS